MTQLNGKKDKTTIIVKDFNNPLSMTDRSRITISRVERT